MAFISISLCMKWVSNDGQQTLLLHFGIYLFIENSCNAGLEFGQNTISNEAE